jgi:hypothetical protein
MLSEKQIQAIREEEELRFVVRREIERRFTAPKTRLGSVLSFLNTSVGTFFLSTVLIGMITYFHATISETMARSAERAEQQRKIRLEIVNRLEEISCMKTKFDAHYRTVVRTAFDGFHPGDTQSESYRFYYSAMFPELRERTLKSLVYELVTSTEGKKAARLRTMLPAVRSLHTFYDRLEYDQIPAGPHTPNREKVEFFYLKPSDEAGFQKAFAVLMSLDGTP